MSTWTCVRLEMNDADVITEAMKEMGYTVVKPTARTEVFADGRGKVKADLIVKASKKDGIVNDISFTKKPDGTYDMVLSYADKRKKINVDGKSMSMIQRLKQLYGSKKVLKYARQRGFMLSSKTTDATGRIKIKLSVS